MTDELPNIPQAPNPSGTPTTPTMPIVPDHLGETCAGCPNHPARES